MARFRKKRKTLKELEEELREVEGRRNEARKGRALKREIHALEREILAEKFGRATDILKETGLTARKVAGAAKELGKEAYSRERMKKARRMRKFLLGDDER